MTIATRHPSATSGPARARSLAALVFAAALALSSTGLRAQGVDALEAAAERFATVTTLCADFHQELRIELLRQTKSSEGRICQRRPDLFSMEYSDPAGDRIVADGTYFWLWLPSESPGQVIRIPMSSQPGGFDFYREFLEDPMVKYEVVEAGSEEIDGVATHAVRLVPRERGDWRSAMVWIDPSTRLIRRVEITENEGTVRRITLSDIDLRPELAADHFVYEVPAGATVVPMGGGR